MHQACFEYVARKLPTDITKTTRVVEFGSKDINGNIKALLGQAEYVGVDREPGTNVDIVCDCRDYLGKADIVLCLELLEHCDDLNGVVQAIVETIDDYGIAIITCATDPRPPHSGYDGGAVHAGEYYKNISEKELLASIKKAGGKYDLKDVEVDLEKGDLRVKIYVD